MSNISKEWFTSTNEEIIAKFNGLANRPSKNGVYLVAHTDTVHKELPTAEDIQIHRDVWTCPSKGLGADDRAGCYIVHKLATMFPECGYLLSSDEETGDVKFKQNCPDLNTFGVKPKFFISFDRKGINEYVTYGHDSKAVEDWLLTQGIRKETGSRSTVEYLSFTYKVPNVNMCFGGGGFHSKTEYLDSSMLERMMSLYIALVKWSLDTELDYIPPEVFTYAYPKYPLYGVGDYDYGKWWKAESKTSKGCATYVYGNSSKKPKKCVCCGDEVGNTCIVYRKHRFCSKECLEYYYNVPGARYGGENGETVNYLTEDGMCTAEGGGKCERCLNGCFMKRAKGLETAFKPSEQDIKQVVGESYLKTVEDYGIDTFEVSNDGETVVCDDCFEVVPKSKTTSWNGYTVCEKCLGTMQDSAEKGTCAEFEVQSAYSYI